VVVAGRAILQPKFSGRLVLLVLSCQYALHAQTRPTMVGSAESLWVPLPQLVHIRSLHFHQKAA